MIRHASGALVAGLVLAGCGSGTPPMTPSASRMLSADVLQLQTAAHAGDAGQIARTADQLRADLAALRASGQVSSTRATVVLDELTRVLADTALTLAVTPPPAPPPPAGPGPAHGKGRDKGGDGGG